jgi:hypothetical protein
MYKVPSDQPRPPAPWGSYSESWLPLAVRPAVLIMLLLGFLGPWFETCSGTIHGYHAYLVGSVMLVMLPLPFLFIVVLVNLVRDAGGESEYDPSHFELGMSALSLIVLGVVGLGAARDLFWGYWGTLGGVALALLAALVSWFEATRGPPPGRE